LTRQSKTLHLLLRTAWFASSFQGV